MMGEKMSEATVRLPGMKSYVISCSNCQANTASCDNCVMAFIKGPGFGPIRFTEEEKEALCVMADAGLIPRLQLVAA